MGLTIYPPETLQSVRTVTGDTTLQAGDDVVEVNSASPQTVTIPSNTFSVGRRIVIRALGAGDVTIAAGGGVTLRLPGTKTGVIADQYGEAYVAQRAANEWVAGGSSLT